MKHELRIMEKKKAHLRHYSRDSLFAIRDSSRGFTLMESIVAIGVFTVGISVCINLVSSVLANAGTRTKNRIIAGYLAQEGIETVRNIRDNNWAEGVDWLTDITTCTMGGCEQTNGCVVWNSDSIDFTPSCQSNLVFNALANPPAYAQTSGASQFSRVIGVNMISSTEIKITATSTCGTNCSVSLSEHLYNWK